MKGMSFAVVLLSATLAGLVISSYVDFRNAMYADDGATPKDKSEELCDELMKEVCALGETDLLDPDTNVIVNIRRMRAASDVLNADDKRLLANMEWRFLDITERWFGLPLLIIDDKLAENPAKVQKIRASIAKLRDDITRCWNNYHRLLVQCFPNADTVEPLRREYNKTCRWRPHKSGYDLYDIEDNLRAMYAFADTGAVYTEDEKKELDDLGVRFYRGYLLESELSEFISDDDAMSKPANVEKARRLLAEFKKVAGGWDDARWRLWRKVLDMATVAEHEKRLKDAAKALESADEKPEATPPK